jgi:hypothetical protein
VGEKTILKFTLAKLCENSDWIQGVRDSIQQGSMAKTVLKLPRCIKGDKFIDELSG